MTSYDQIINDLGKKLNETKNTYIKAKEDLKVIKKDKKSPIEEIVYDLIGSAQSSQNLLKYSIQSEQKCINLAQNINNELNECNQYKIQHAETSYSDYIKLIPFNIDIGVMCQHFSGQIFKLFFVSVRIPQVINNY